jgi:hypothetical protein
VSAEETLGDGEVAVHADGLEDGATAGKDPPYTKGEWSSALIPVITFLTAVVLVVVSWYLVTDTGTEDPLLDDMDESGSFNLQGQWVEQPKAYGPHTKALNLTLEHGDTLTLTYSAHGPPGGIQVRVQHPLDPSDGVNGTGGARVFASSVGGNGTVDLFVENEGAYQVYFWHPGVTKAPGPDDDPDDHTLAAVGYRLVVNRANRP